MLNATPGNSTTIQYSLSGFDLEPHVKWTFVPSYPTSKRDDFAEIFLKSTASVFSNATKVSLLIPNVLYRHAGLYVTTITHPRTGEQMVKSCKCLSTDELLIELICYLIIITFFQPDSP